MIRSAHEEAAEALVSPSKLCDDLDTQHVGPRSSRCGAIGGRLHAGKPTGMQARAHATTLL
jgi:hypothetical protein